MSNYLLPGSVIGILGGGPVGRSIALAARELGYRVRVLDSDPSCAVGSIAERSVFAPIEDAAAAAEALRGCDVVTSSVEHVPMDTFTAILRAGVPVRPAPALVAVAQNRVLERDWLEARGIPLVPWRAVTTFSKAVTAFAEMRGPCVLKPALRRGRAVGVRRVETVEELAAAWNEFGRVHCAMEQTVEIDSELSVVVARSPDGSVATYRPAESRRSWCDGTPRLLWSVFPAGVPAQHSQKTRRLATSVAERLGVEGLLAVEMFLLTDGRLVVNEIVPCPHPTFVAAERACATGQYEQLIRAICGLPLGATAVVHPVAVAPIYGDSWRAGAPSRIDSAIRMPGVTIHVDGVVAPAPSQRVGHLVASGDSPELAIGRVMHAASRLAGLESPPPLTVDSEEVVRASRAQLYDEWRKATRGTARKVPLLAAFALLFSACTTVRQDQVGVKGIQERITATLDARGGASIAKVHQFPGGVTGIALLAAAAPAAAQAPAKCGSNGIAVFDSRLVMAAAPGRAAAEVRYEGLIAETRTRLSAAIDSLQQVVSLFAREEASFSPRQREAATHMLRARELALEELSEKLNMQAEGWIGELSEPVVAEVRTAAEAFRKEARCVLLLDRAALQDGLVADTAADVTSRIIDLIRKREASRASRT